MGGPVDPSGGDPLGGGPPSGGLGRRAAVARGIRKRGFRKWYERELLFGHSHLVLLLLCTLTFIGALEAWSAEGAERALIAVSAVIAVVVGVWALRRYLFLLLRAEQIANQAACPHCETYARWDIEREAHDAEGSQLLVSCKRCNRRWPIAW
jgi:hypothetical protein